MYCILILSQHFMQKQKKTALDDSQGVSKFMSSHKFGSDGNEEKNMNQRTGFFIYLFIYCGLRAKT